MNMRMKMKKVKHDIPGKGMKVGEAAIAISKINSV